MDIFCSAQPTACISLSFLLPVSRISLSLPLSQLLLSQSISCRDFTSLFTTYLPSAALPLVICSAFSTLLDMHLSLTPSSDAALFSSILVQTFFFFFHWVG